MNKNEKTEAVIELLNTTLLSYREVGALLGLTTGAISGIATRNLKRITRKRRAPPSKVGASTAPRPMTDHAWLKPPVDAAAYREAMVNAVVSAKPDTCRWPLGQPDGFFYCGDPAEADRPYCVAHRKAAKKVS